MALDSFVKSDLEGTITLTDGAANTMTLAFDNGDLSVGPLADTLNEALQYERRGRFKSAGLGARLYPAGSFTAMVHQFTDATADVLSDFILKRGKFSGNQSTYGATHPVYAIDLKFDLEGSSFGGVDSTVTFADCRCQIDTLGEGRPTTFSISFTSTGAVTGDLAVAEIA
jgi:hypothetical protein